MPDPIIENQSLPPSDVPDNIPDLDAELDNALNNAFPNQTIQKEEKDPEKIDPKQEVKEIVEHPKNDGKPLAEVKEVLPDPEQVEQAPPGRASSQSKDGWNALRNNYKKAHRLAQERDEEIKKLKEGLAEKGSLTQKETDALKSQIEELSRYRAMVDIQADPEFISKYEQPIERSIGSIKEMLISLNVNEDLVNQIDFSNTKLMDDIIGHVAENKDKFIARKLQRKVEDLMDLNDKRSESLEVQRKNYKEILESKKKEMFSKEAEGEGRLFKHLETIKAAKDKNGGIMFPFLHKQEPKEESTQAEIDKIGSHNRLVDLMQEKIQAVIKMTSPEDKAEIAVAAVGAHYLGAQLKAALNKIQSLESEIQKISAVNSEAPKKQNGSRVNGAEKPMDLDSAMAAHFAR